MRVKGTLSAKWRGRFKQAFADPNPHFAPMKAFHRQGNFPCFDTIEMVSRVCRIFVIFDIVFGGILGVILVTRKRLGVRTKANYYANRRAIFSIALAPELHTAPAAEKEKRIYM